MRNKNIRVLWFTFMLLVFIVPHISNNLHYVIVKHTFGKKNNSLEWVDSNTVHYCEQYLCKTAPLLEITFFQWEVFLTIEYKKVMDFVKEHYRDLSVVYLKLRGPPNSSNI